MAAALSGATASHVAVRALGSPQLESGRALVARSIPQAKATILRAAFAPRREGGSLPPPVTGISAQGVRERLEKKACAEGGGLGAHPQCTRAAAAAAAGAGPEGTGRDMKDVVEHVMLFKMPVQLPLEQEQEFLDHLYTLQYHYRHVLSTSLGRIFSKVSDGYTHGAVIRLPSTDNLAAFLAHPTLQQFFEKYVDPFCEGRISLSFEAKVENDLEALFRRGEAFESGIEHLVFVKPKEGATAEQQEGMLEAVRQLPHKVGPTVVQLTAGTILPEENDSGFRHALIVRVLSEEDLTTYNKHPAHREVIRKHLLPMASKILSVDFSVDPVGTEKPAI